MTGSIVTFILLCASILPIPPPILAQVTMYLNVLNSHQLDEPKMRWVLNQAGWDGQQLEEALAISWCESRWQPKARNGIMLGLFQLWDGWFYWAKIETKYWANPIINAKLARLVYTHRGRWGGAGGWACAGGN